MFLNNNFLKNKVKFFNRSRIDFKNSGKNNLNLTFMINQKRRK